VIAWALSYDGMIVVDDGSKPTIFLCVSTLLSLALKRYFWLLNYETVYSFIAK